MPESHGELGKVKKRSVGANRTSTSVEIQTPLQTYGLELLGRVLAVQSSYENEAEKDQWLLHAINRAVYSAYIDCIDEGVGDSAKAMLKGKVHLN